MLLLKILLVTFGTIFSLFGYFIYAKKRYNLINGFKDNFKAGRKDESYAQKVGLIEFCLGLILILIGIILLAFL